MMMKREKNHTQLCRHSVKSINETRQRIVEQSELREANQLLCACDMFAPRVRMYVCVRCYLLSVLSVSVYMHENRKS